MKFNPNVFARRLEESFEDSGLTKKEITRRVNNLDEGINFNSMRLKRGIDKEMDLTAREIFALANVMGVHPAYLLLLQKFEESFTRLDVDKNYKQGYEDALVHAQEHARGVALHSPFFNLHKGV